MRSILADPRFVENRDRVNDAVKFRENWRPFAPSVLVERAPEYFDNFYPSPYMILTFWANKAKAQPAAATESAEPAEPAEPAAAEAAPSEASEAAAEVAPIADAKARAAQELADDEILDADSTTALESRRSAKEATR